MNSKIPIAVSVLFFALAIHAEAKDSPPALLPITLGQTNVGTIALPGQADRFSFSGTLGQRLYYDALDLDYESIVATLYGPSGAAVPGFSINHSSDYGPFYLPETGGYTLVIKGSGDTVGDYSFRLLDMAGATLLGYDTNVSGQLNPQSSTVAYR